jgi:hypothetical protein
MFGAGWQELLIMIGIAVPSLATTGSKQRGFATPCNRRATTSLSK